VLDQALAAHNNGGVVIAQVKRLAESRTLPAQAVRVPGIVVDAIVVAPDQLQTTQTVLLPEAAGHFRAPVSELELAPWGPEKVVARRASQELRDGEAVNLGFGISALVPRVLLEEGLDGSVTWVIEQGAVGGVPFLGFQFGCAQNPDALLASPDQFTYLQGGGFDRALLSLSRNEAIPLEPMKVTMAPEWETFPQWMAHLDRLPLGINLSQLVPVTPDWCTGT
jgi:acyl CoA:acetate/3-ketoacid CoA transferase